MVYIADSSDPELLRLWCRLAGAAPIPPLVWETSYALGVTLKKKKAKSKMSKMFILFGRGYDERK